MSGEAKRYQGPIEIFHPPLAVKLDPQKARKRFWPTLWRVAGRIPFAEDLAAAWYCAVDPKTPTRVKAVLMGAVAYFVLPADMIPDVLLGIGFTDDATVLATAIGIVGAHIKPRHRDQARTRLKTRAPEPDESKAA